MSAESPGSSRTFGVELFASAGEAVPLAESRAVLSALDEAVHVLADGAGPLVARAAEITTHGRPSARRVLALDGPAGVERLCRRDLLDEHGLRWPYLAGSMTQGIASVPLVTAMARAGMLGFFGAGGLTLPQVEDAVVRLKAELPGGEAFGVNLINTLDPARERATVDLFLRHGVRRIEAAAYLGVTPGLVRFRLQGVRARPDGTVEAPNHVFGKCSREEIADQFWAPAPPAMVEALRREGAITDEAARLAPHLPVAQDVIAEADSAGHTDNRPALVLFPTFHALRHRAQERHRYRVRLRLGAAGGISTPETTLAAFTLGADFVLTGSVNQGCVEAGTSPEVKQLLAQASMTDVTCVPSADMFELGAKVQVLTRGLLFHSKAKKLQELFQNYGSLEEIPAAQRTQLEERVFHDRLERIWDSTRTYLERADPAGLARAEQSPKQKMSYVFRWYLGLSSRWAIQGDPARKVDYQVFCGPGMGAFNRWAKGSFLERPEERRAAEVARNLLEGALYLERCRALTAQGVELPDALRRVHPRRFA